MLKGWISRIYAEHKGRYGYRRITAVLCQGGQEVNHKCVQRLMQLMDLKSTVRPKKYRSYRGEVGQVAPNLLQRQFTAEKPNSKWVTDVTEFSVGGKKLYLSPIMDLFNREIMAYQIQRRPEFDLVKTMLTKAINKLNAKEKPIVHSDQGWQYQMRYYQEQLRSYGLKQSMSRKGNCLDNAAMESFFGVLKTECFHRRKFSSIEHLEQTLHEYICYYNHDRIKL